MTPTARTLLHLRKQGYLAAVVERRIPKSFITQDLFGCIDVIGIRAGQTLAVQVTGDNGGNVSARIAKVKAAPAWPVMLAAGWTVVVQGWGKRGAKGKRKLWTLREVAVTANNEHETNERNGQDGRE